MLIMATLIALIVTSVILSMYIIGFYISVICLFEKRLYKVIAFIAYNLCIYLFGYFIGLLLNILI